MAPCVKNVGGCQCCKGLRWESCNWSKFLSCWLILEVSCGAEDGEHLGERNTTVHCAVRQILAERTEMVCVMAAVMTTVSTETSICQLKILKWRIIELNCISRSQCELMLLPLRCSQIHISKHVQAPTLCPKGTQTPPKGRRLHNCWQNTSNTKTYLRTYTWPNLVPKGHTDTPQLNNTPQLLAEYIQYKNIYQNMYRPQPFAQRAHRHPPTEQNPTIVGRIHPTQIHISDHVQAPTLCPKGTLTPPNWTTLHNCWQNISNTNTHLRSCSGPNLVPEGHADTP